MRICVFGAGYVGLVTAACLADLGHRVLCVDTDEDKVRLLRASHVSFFEPGLLEVVRRNVRAHRLDFDIQPHDFDAQIWIVAVGTPPKEDGSADLNQVISVTDQIAQIARSPGLVVIKSTVPPGTCDDIAASLYVLRRSDLHVVSNPEFLKEGTAVEDFFRPDRIVIGTNSSVDYATMLELYWPLALSGNQILCISRRSAELAKYACNAMLASRISFMNEMARLCESLRANVHEVRATMALDSRIGPAFLYAGAGYGGSCFPKDVNALVHAAHKAGVSTPLLASISYANRMQREHIWWLLYSAMNQDLEGKKVAFWGLAFKPQTDDVREAPAWYIVQQCLFASASVSLYDPEAIVNFETQYTKGIDRVSYSTNEYDVLEEADALVLMTEWHVFRAPDWAEVAKRMKGRVVVDARSIWTTQDLEKKGFSYSAVGVGARG